MKEKKHSNSKHMNKSTQIFYKSTIEISSLWGENTVLNTDHQ
jgi:hypothetical protein